ncbi:MAG: hypothetical protein COA71_06600 [SAR86 cluster bacterium]|uniref:Uncharacterized protein n=1 Tax=SAR86 cluster bacterium TaxID=2030880 RepID=A0A2A5CCV4_9GAMM|nr:sulfotransferase [bacterium AH-315-I11]MBN4075526.1 sulfotransferase [Gammaproteobacteria bacterium AH-315-E17]PCJ41679.1 MAG: hypothetical protein COA71_06600 [SAR86 cluster bacterium]
MTSTNIIKQCVSLLEQGSAIEAEKLLLPILKNEPDNFHALQLFGLAKHLLGNPQEALIYLEKAMQINPEFSAVRHNIAGIYRALGDMKEAEKNYRKATQLKPDYGEAYQGLAEILRFKNNDPLLKTIEKQLTLKLNSTNTSYLHFAAGKIYDDCGDYANAFKHFSSGNDLSSHSWNDQEQTSYQQAIKNTYNSSYFSNRTARGYTSKAPIFIVGMPRSGSTLVEQILASHSQVFGAGEINDIPSIAGQIGTHSSENKNYPECMQTLPSEACAGMGGAYLNRVFQLRGHKKTATHSIDKNLFNINHLGLISDLLPGAHIIHIQRHPLDTCLSCYFQNFSTGVHWSFDLDNIVFYYRLYREMVAHWEQVLPLSVLALKYENLITQAELTSRQLVTFCGLNWEENCLHFYRNKRTVKTASVWQVRQPIYKRSLGRWQNYAPYIDKLKQGLADYIDDYENGLTQKIKRKKT